MKNIFLYVFILASTIGWALNSNAQVGVTKFGTNALANNMSTGEYNTGLGYYSLGANTSGNRNSASGANALRFNTTGHNNTAIGAAALYQNKGFKNSAVGAHSLFTNTTGFQNTAFGDESLYFNTVTGGNTAIGFRSLYNNTGPSNTANGERSLFSNASGVSNTATGSWALHYNNTGNFNTATGATAFIYNTTGEENVAVGYYSLHQIEKGSRNTALGSYTHVGPNLVRDNSTAIGYHAVADGTNRVRIGNASVVSIGGQVGWTTFSTARLKNDTKENIPGLAFINSLRPVTYTVNVKSLHEFYNKAIKSANVKNSGGSEDETEKAAMEKSDDAAAKIIYNGFMAQEVELAAKKLNFEFSGVDKPETNDGLYGLRYDNFISPLVKSLQELSAKNAENDSSIVNLKSQASDLQNEINELKSLIAKSNDGPTIPSTAYLKQNVPNPFRNNTIISYYIPYTAGNAEIMITDINGRVIRTFNASKGEGKINIRSGELAAGNYNYTLYINNKKVDTKKMVLLK